MVTFRGALMPGHPLFKGEGVDSSVISASEKRCSKCGGVKPLAEFSRDKSRRGGRRSCCKQCNREVARLWREQNRERHREYNRLWYEQNRERDREYTRRRRARLRDAQYLGHTVEQLQQRLDYYGGKCWICRTRDYEHWDHVKPVAKGGAHILANLRPACATCNLAKGDRWPFRPEEIVC